jgi:D-arabinan endo alpha-(1,5)-arabinofuranosidase
MVRVIGATRLARITGEDSCNRTASRFGIHATDLGIMWDDGRGGVLAAFGDTYGDGWGGHGAGPKHADWRYNVIARSTNTDLDAGLQFDSVMQREDGMAGQVLPGDRTGVHEHTVIPTAGIAIGGRNFLHYMSVRRWGMPGVWHTNYGALAYSDDGGRTWTKSASAVWPNQRQGWLSRFRRRDQGGHSFQMIGFAGVVDGRVYLLGTPSGRFGAGHLARVGADDLLEPAAYEYWTGSGWRGDPFAAAPVLRAPVAELSVQYNRHFGRWFAVHLDEHRAAIVLRTAPELTGPWTDGEIVVSGADYPALYGGFQHPWAADRPAIYFTLTQWGPYNVDFFRADLA